MVDALCTRGWMLMAPCVCLVWMCFGEVTLLWLWLWTVRELIWWLRLRVVRCEDLVVV